MEVNLNPEQTTVAWSYTPRLRMEILGREIYEATSAGLAPSPRLYDLATQASFVSYPATRIH